MLLLPEPGPETICTLIHISDPHFGTTYFNNGTKWWHEMLARVPIVNHVTGLFPHDYQTATALAVAIRHLLRDRMALNIPAIVVHTGDLTASGKAAQFVVGATYFSHGHVLDDGLVGGLMLGSERMVPFDIPGNHDMWSRSSPKSHAAFTSRYGGSYPRAYPLAIQTPHGQVNLFGLDSNRSRLWAHRLANGEVPDTQLHRLAELLPASQAHGIVNVVTLHHPVASHSNSAPKFLGMEILGLKDRHKLAAELKRMGVHMLLSGHVHHQHFCKAETIRPLQFVAGSCAQINTNPSFWVLDVGPKSVRAHTMSVLEPNMQFTPEPCIDLPYN